MEISLENLYVDIGAERVNLPGPITVVIPVDLQDLHLSRKIVK